MKIYFAGSIRGGRDDKEFYLKLITYLQKHGEVLTEHIGDKKLTELGESELSDMQIYNRDVSWVRESDAIVAEVSMASLGVGYEIREAEASGKKILCLYRPKEGKRLSAMLAGNKNLVIREYNDLPEAFRIVDEFFAAQKSF